MCFLYGHYFFFSKNACLPQCHISFIFSPTLWFCILRYLVKMIVFINFYIHSKWYWPSRLFCVCVCKANLNRICLKQFPMNEFEFLVANYLNTLVCALVFTSSFNLPSLFLTPMYCLDCSSAHYCFWRLFLVFFGSCKSFTFPRKIL